MKIYLIFCVLSVVIAGTSTNKEKQNGQLSQSLQSHNIQTSLVRNKLIPKATGQNQNGQRKPTQQNAQQKSGGGQKPKPQQKQQAKPQQKPKTQPKPGQKQQPKPKPGGNNKPKPNGQQNNKPKPGKSNPNENKPMNSPVPPGALSGPTPYGLPLSGMPAEVDPYEPPIEEQYPPPVIDQDEAELPNYDFGGGNFDQTTQSNREKVKKGKYKSSRRRTEQESFEEEYEYHKSRRQ